MSRLQIKRDMPLKDGQGCKFNSTMVTIVVSLNIALGIFCLGIAWKLVQFKSSLRRATRWLIMAERHTDRALNPAPYYILLGQTSVKEGRGRIAKLDALQQQIMRFSALLTLLQWIS